MPTKHLPCFAALKALSVKGKDDMQYMFIHICLYTLQIYLPFAALLLPVQRAGGRGADISTHPRTSLRRIFCDIKDFLEKYNKDNWKYTMENISRIAKATLHKLPEK